MPFVPMRQRTAQQAQQPIQVTEEVNQPNPPQQNTQQPLHAISEDTVNQHEANDEFDVNDLEELLHAVLDELATVKSLLLEKNAAYEKESEQTAPKRDEATTTASTTAANKLNEVEDSPRSTTKRNALDFSTCF